MLRIMIFTVVNCFVTEIRNQHVQVANKVAVRSEIKLPKYFDLQTVRREDGLSRFQAMALSSFSCVSSFSLGEHAFSTFTLRLLNARYANLWLLSRCILGK